ncbi:MAG: hypothetical protein ACOY3P_20340 [Planctomycetota bacterium]
MNKLKRIVRHWWAVVQAVWALPKYMVHVDSTLLDRKYADESLLRDVVDHAKRLGKLESPIHTVHSLSPGAPLNEAAVRAGFMEHQIKITALNDRISALHQRERDNDRRWSEVQRELDGFATTLHTFDEALKLKTRDGQNTGETLVALDKRVENIELEVFQLGGRIDIAGDSRRGMEDEVGKLQNRLTATERCLAGAVAQVGQHAEDLGEINASLGQCDCAVEKLRTGFSALNSGFNELRALVSGRRVSAAVAIQGQPAQQRPARTRAAVPKKKPVRKKKTSKSR